MNGGGGVGDIMGTVTNMSTRNIQAGLAVALILGSVLYMKREKKAGREPGRWVKLAFPIGWFLLALTVGVGAVDKISGPQQLIAPRPILAFAAAAMVVGSMGYSLPQQRKKCEVDGPGMPLFVAAWAILAGLVGSR